MRMAQKNRTPTVSALDKLLPPLARVRNRTRYAAREVLLRARLLFARGITHVHGPADRLSLDEEELVVLCLVRNGAPWLHAFIRHYQRLGAKHIILLDNGSTDDSINIATSYDGVSIFSTTLPFAQYKIALKRWLVKRFGRGGWSLVCDVDELFDYPFSGVLDLPSFLRYLNHRGYTAVVAQMLDVFSAEPLAAVQGRTEEDIEEVYRFYDITNITKTRDAHWVRSNRMDTDALASHSGGIRSSAFGVNRSKLTKHPLIRWDRDLNVFPHNEHFVTNASLADVTGVLRHYKFIGAFYEQMRDAIRQGQYFKGSKTYRQYHTACVQHPDLCLHGPTAREFHRPEDFLESGFLVASGDYLEWVRAHGGAMDAQSAG